MFNLSGGEVVVLLLIGLVVLGPEKLPDAMRKFGRVYNEVRRVATGIQRDVTSTFSEPVSELRKTANDARRMFTGDDGPADRSADHEPEPTFVPYEPPDAASNNPLNPDPSEDDDAAG